MAKRCIAAVSVVLLATGCGRDAAHDRASRDAGAAADAKPVAGSPADHPAKPQGRQGGREPDGGAKVDGDRVEPGGGAAEVDRDRVEVGGGAVEVSGNGVEPGAPTPDGKPKVAGLKVKDGEVEVGGVVVHLDDADESKQSCSQGTCAQACAAGDDCHFTCSGGGCAQSCAKGSTCRLTCSGGGCAQGCAPGATCELTCSGGSCKQACAGESCKASCSGDGCAPQPG